MWHWRSKARNGVSPGDVDATSATGLEAAAVSEACAIIEGRVLDQLRGKGHPVPPWAWLNALAHRPPDQLRNLTGVGCDQLVSFVASSARNCGRVGLWRARDVRRPSWF